MSGTLKQFFKFLITGANNTGLDFLVLNLLMLAFRIYKGWPIILFNIISFSIAVTNSYLINRFWTFRLDENKKIYKTQIFLIIIIIFILINLKFLKNKFVFIFLAIVFFIVVLLINIYIVKNFLSKENFAKSSLEFSKFVFLTVIGMAINTGIVYYLTSFVSPFFGLTKVLWANFSKAVATCISLFWNFTCYKFVVFKR
ncbi:MAG: GtrA family protein [Patescibacteria group bacterium]